MRTVSEIIWPLDAIPRDEGMAVDTFEDCQSDFVEVRSQSFLHLQPDSRKVAMIDSAEQGLVEKECKGRRLGLHAETLRTLYVLAALQYRH